MAKIETHVYEKEPVDFAPQVAITAIYVHCGNKLLILQLGASKEEAGTWGVPAGKLELGEDPLSGAQRELYEETGIQTESLQSLGKLYIRKPNYDYVYYLFSIHLNTVPTIGLSCEHCHYQWVTREEAKNLSLISGGLQALTIYYARNP